MGQPGDRERARTAVAPRRHIRRALPLGGLLALGLAVSVAAADSLAYGDRGNRLEGHRRIEVAAPEFEALSFVRGPARFPTERGVAELRFFLPQPARVHVTARELLTITYYQMRVKQTQWPQGWNVFTPWETSSVIVPLSVQPANVGVLARIGEEAPGSGELGAIAFGRDASGPEWSTYEFQFRVKYDTTSVVYTVERDESGDHVAGDTLRSVSGGVPTALRFNLSSAREGRYRLVADCLYRGRPGGPQRTFVFFHKP